MVSLPILEWLCSVLPRKAGKMSNILALPVQWNSSGSMLLMLMLLGMMLQGDAGSAGRVMEMNDDTELLPASHWPIWNGTHCATC